MSKKKFKEKKEKRNKKEKGGMYDALMLLLEEMAGKAYSPQQLVKKLGLKKKALIEDMYKLLDALEQEGRVEQLSSGQYKSTRSSKSVTGVVDHVNPRFAYIVTGEEGKKDIYVRSQDLGSAVHGDTVEVVSSGRKSGDNPEGKVTGIVKRGRTRFVGRIELSRNFGFVVPDFKKIYQDFFIYPENLNGATANDKVLFEVTKWADRDKSPEGKVIEILGKTGENEAEIHSIMAEFDLPFRFPENVLKLSETISEDITKEEIGKRRDFRDVLTFTIDPKMQKILMMLSRLENLTTVCLR
jgi:ribonuclease R